MKHLAILSGAFCCLLLGGCENLDRVEFCVINARSSAQVNESMVRIEKGTVVALKASPISTDGDYMDDDIPMRLETANPGVLGVARLDYESDNCGGPDSANWYFVLYGVETGQTTLAIWAGEYLWREIPVEVLSP